MTRSFEAQVSIEVQAAPLICARPSARGNPGSGGPFRHGTGHRGRRRGPPVPPELLEALVSPAVVPVELVADLAPLVIVMVVFLRRVEGRGRHNLRGDRLLEASRLLQSALGGFGQPLL